MELSGKEVFIMKIFFVPRAPDQRIFDRFDSNKTSRTRAYQIFPMFLQESSGTK